MNVLTKLIPYVRVDSLHACVKSVSFGGDPVEN